LRSWLLLGLLMLTVISNLPALNSVEAVRGLLYLGFGLAALFTIPFRRVLDVRLAKQYGLLMFIVLALVLPMALLGGNVPWSFLLTMAVPLILLLISAGTTLDPGKYVFAVSGYVLLASVMGVATVLSYQIGGAVSVRYMVEGKNQVGPILGIACILALCRLVAREEPLLVKALLGKALYMFALFVLFSSLILVRNRTGIVAVLILAGIVLFRELRRLPLQRRASATLITSVVLGAAILLGWMEFVGQYLWDSLTLNYDVSDPNSLSTGRVAGYAEAARFLGTYPLFGEVFSGEYLGSTAHNFLLNAWVRFGLIGAIPVGVIYLVLWGVAVLGVVRAVAGVSPEFMTACALLFTLLVSLAEYTYPFGPGTSTAMVWFLLGQHPVHAGSMPDRAEGQAVVL